MRGNKAAAARSKSAKEKEKPSAATAKKKEKRVWAETSDVKNLDYSVNGNARVEEALDLKDMSRMEETDGSDIEIEEEEEKSGKASSGMLSSFWRGISVNVMGSNALTREDFQKALDSMKRKLMERNVAQEIAEKYDDISRI